MEIDISDASMISNDGGNFPLISKFWNKAENQTELKSDFIKLMVWGIYCAYHKKAIENIHKGQTIVHLSELDLKYIKHKFEESLLNTENDYYKELRTDYRID